MQPYTRTMKAPNKTISFTLTAQTHCKNGKPKHRNKKKKNTSYFQKQSSLFFKYLNSNIGKMPAKVEKYSTVCRIVYDFNMLVSIWVTDSSHPYTSCSQEVRSRPGNNSRFSVQIYRNAWVMECHDPSIWQRFCRRAATTFKAKNHFKLG